jgi:dsRNA-specific ribonuclease
MAAARQVNSRIPLRSAEGTETGDEFVHASQLACTKVHQDVPREGRMNMTAKEMKKAGYRSDKINAVMKARRASDKLWKRAFDAMAAARVAKAEWEQAQRVASEVWAKAVMGTPPRYVYHAPKKSALERR